MGYYLLLFTSALLFAFGFLFTKWYRKYESEGVISALKMYAIAGIVIALMFFVKNALTEGKIIFYFSC